MTALQYLTTELKMEPGPTTQLHSFLSAWKHHYRAGVSEMLDRKAWRKRRDIVTNPNEISDRILGYQMGVADGLDEAVKIIDSLVESLASRPGWERFEN